MIQISGTTRICGLFGFPVKHSFSPAMHNAAFSFLGLDYVYIPFQVAPENLSTAISALQSLGITGVNITVPHKQKVIPFLDEISPEAKLIGAVNTVINTKGRLCGYNTDGDGFLRSLKEELDFTPEKKTVLILGAGGAARAVAVGLVLAGAKEILLTNRTLQRAEKLAYFMAENTQAQVRAVSWSMRNIAEVVEKADLIVQTTSVGMYPQEACIEFPFELLRSEQAVYDLVYNPRLTMFLKRAKASGARTAGGLGMLLYQGASAFELWTGVKAPIEVMYKTLKALANV